MHYTQDTLKCCGSNDWTSWAVLGACVPASCSSGTHETNCLTGTGGALLQTVMDAVTNVLQVQKPEALSYETGCVDRVAVIAWVIGGFICAVIFMTLTSFMCSVCCGKSGGGYREVRRV